MRHLVGALRFRIVILVLWEHQRHLCWNQALGQCRVMLQMAVYQENESQVSVIYL